MINTYLCGAKKQHYFEISPKKSIKNIKMLNGKCKFARGVGVNIKREKKTESLRWQIIIESN